jgi:MFS family permease
MSVAAETALLAEQAEPTAPDVRPNRTLGLLVVAHAVNHAQAVILPLMFLKVIAEFGVGVEAVAFLTAAGNVSSGVVQLSFASLTRLYPRRWLLGAGGILFGGGFAAQAFTTTFAAFSVANIVSRIGGSPQHPVGNGLLSEQFGPGRRGFAISAHIAGGNVGTVFVAVAGSFLIASLGWRGTSILLGVPAILVAFLILRLVRESGTDRAAAIARGSVRQSFRAVLRDHDIRWIYLTSVLGGGGRGLGVANLFALLYLTEVVHLDDATAGLMYGVLIVLSVPMPLLAGWLSDRLGRRPVIIGVYLGGALGFVVFVLGGGSMLVLWLGIGIMGLFSFAESPQLQALLADVAQPGLRDTAFSTYFTLAFGVGALWTVLYGVIIDTVGASAGLPIVFWLMAGSFVLAAAAMLPVREPGGWRGPRSGSTGAA